MKNQTDYNSIACNYDERYSVNYLKKIESSLINIASNDNIQSILEAGCGTGRWLKSLSGFNKDLFGIDYSMNMLKLANKSYEKVNLVNADATNFPFREKSFDMIFCINAIHHFPDKEKFFNNAQNALRKTGILCIYGVDPFIDSNWYVYDYFDNVYEKDLIRFPSLETLRNLCNKFNFIIEQQIVVETIFIERFGNEVFSDPFLKKHMNSQLANLSEDEYQRGINKIKEQINSNPETKFVTDIKFYLTKAIKEGG